MTSTRVALTVLRIAARIDQFCALESLMTDAAGNAPFIVFDRVTRRYGAFRLALADFSMVVERGEFVLIVGPNGSGKSTVLRLIAALDSPSSGRVLVGGALVSGLKRRALCLLRQSMGVVPQQALLLEDRNTIENVMLPALVAGQSRKEADRRARAALERVALDAAKKRTNELSGSERQRLALARAIVNRPALVLADEPTAHLDPDSTRSILQLLEQFAIAGVTVVVATHRPYPHAPSRARVVGLRDGRLAS